ncbi:MAG: DNA-3-methyladenine glycosylase 2 family protein [Myxococcales bacterium]|jgi:3-methyladenine DNA glycosylase/8-oxoguanine DNA glycosylase|nr:DNA-3-methyladenine glycosylase 2 family protein [Myxococcales bacterium]
MPRAPAVLRPVREVELAPAGARYDPRRVLRTPLRALRGGDHGLVVGFGWRAPSLVITVLARGDASDDDVAFAIEAGRGIAAVDDDPDPFVAMVAEHPLLGKLARAHDLRMSRSPTLFESLARGIIEQLVTTAEAMASIGRLWGIAGERVTGTELRAAPTAAAVRRVPMWKMHAIGVGSRRAATLHELAGRGAAIERLRALPPAEVIDKLVSLRGIGPWTANLAVDRGMGYPDAVPVGDLHAPRIITRTLTGEDGGDDATMLEALEPFRPHRARAARLVMRSAERDRPRPRVDPHRREPWKY